MLIIKLLHLAPSSEERWKLVDGEQNAGLGARVGGGHAAQVVLLLAAQRGRGEEVALRTPVQQGLKYWKI